MNTLHQEVARSFIPDTHGPLYIPERLTPLAYTAIYRELSPCQRTRYNQIFGLYFLEQTIFFEQCMGRPAMEQIERTAAEPLRHIARQFIEEEDRHTNWFRALLRESEPSWYTDNTFHLLKVGHVAHVTLGFCSKRPDLFPCLLWLQILAEERAQYFSMSFLRNTDGIDQRFIEVQRRHLADEAGHIRWDVELIEHLWPDTPLTLRRINARLLKWVMREFFYLPKRSAWNVIEHWLAEFPDLSARRPEFRVAMHELGGNTAFLRTLYPKAAFPRTRRLANQWPELQSLENFFTD